MEASVFLRVALYGFLMKLMSPSKQVSSICLDGFNLVRIVLSLLMNFLAEPAGGQCLFPISIYFAFCRAMVIHCIFMAGSEID